MYPTAKQAPVKLPVATSTGSQRRPDIDWLRVLAVLLLVPFHAALVFNLDPNSIVYLKDHVQSDFLVQMDSFIDRWHMPLLFAIAGASTWFALSRRSGPQYMAERFNRLLVPALFGTLALVPLMTNVHWLGQSGAPSLAEMYARFFTLNFADVGGLGGTFTPAHLWFIWFLMIFSLLGLPIFLLLRQTGCQRALARLASWPGSIYLFVVPLALASATGLLGDKNPLYYFLAFVAGYVLLSSPGFQDAIDGQLLLSFILALVATIGGRLVFINFAHPGSAGGVLASLLFQLSRWTWVLVALGAGRRWLSREGALLRYAREAAYPFYIVHLPVLTLVSWYVIRLDVGIPVKYALIVLVTTFLSVAIYDVIVKRVGALRFCFGMKPAVPVVQPVVPSREPAR